MIFKTLESHTNQQLKTDIMNNFNHTNPPLFMKGETLLSTLLEFVYDARGNSISDKAGSNNWGEEDLVFPSSFSDTAFGLLTEYKAITSCKNKGQISYEIEDKKEGDEIDCIKLNSQNGDCQLIFFYDYKKAA